MLLNWFIAESVDEVGISWFDFFSIGHICMGIGIFLVFSLFYTIPMTKKEGTSQIILPLWVVWIITVIVGIAWEFIENILFYELGIKFEHRLDSIANIITDIIFVGLGGLFSWLFAHLVFRTQSKVWAYYLFGLIGLGLWVCVFLILRALMMAV
ncbi:MAG: hypothetical protein EU541_02945 [Promethearchaeota archaeon]|nr:MAG: hypothetical protein EU541_02945 [Candidatus Lokiarchaeota archaeon]